MKPVAVGLLSFASFVLTLPAWCAGEPPIDPAAMDPSVKPGADFFEYANGGWLKTHEIPPQFSEWGSFVELGQRNLEVLRGILEECAREASSTQQGPAEGAKRNLGLLYASGMNEAQVNAEGAKPLQPLLEQIRNLPDLPSLAAVVGRLHLIGAEPLFSFGASVDEKNSGLEIATLVQGGLGLPDRDYYLKTDERSVQVRSAYREHMVRMSKLLEDAPEAANREAEQVLDLETKLAQASKSRVELRDPESNYHKMSSTDLAKLAPEFDWNSYFRALGLSDQAVAQLDVSQPEFCQALSRRLKETPLEVWKAYLRWNLIRSTAPYLSDAFARESFDFYGRTLTGAPEQQSRWKRVVKITSGSLGELLGQQYVEKTFPPSAKERALRMVQDLKQQFRERLQELTWMGPETKKAATEKLDAMGIKVGYPDKWRDYRSLELKAQPYVLNVLAAEEFNSRWDLAKIGRPVDPTEWSMTPQSVNAYYSMTRNEIVFPAGILQPPFFYADADDAVNYGGIGAVIGHEMTHGFDDQGRLYDLKGNLRNWWTPEDNRRFQERGELIVQQFNQYTPIDELHINGKLTEGENIADLGGVKIAYGALQKALERDRIVPDTKIDGFTVEQRFFLSWARIWRMKSRPEALRLDLATDPHSPAKYRVIGPLSNLPEFAAAFDVPPGSPMIRPANLRVNIW